MAWPRLVRYTPCATILLGGKIWVYQIESKYPPEPINVSILKIKISTQYVCLDILLHIIYTVVYLHFEINLSATHIFTFLFGPLELVPRSRSLLVPSSRVCKGNLPTVTLPPRPPYLKDHRRTCNWWITRVIGSPQSRVVPRWNGLFMALNWVLLTT